MKTIENPFEYEAASKLSVGQIIDFYIDDYNYSRFICSKRNVFLIGERGTGKSMTLLFNSFQVQYQKAKKFHKKPNFDIICIYIPCNTPLTHKQEYQLLGDFQATVVSEHFLVLSIMYAIAESLGVSEHIVNKKLEKRLREQLVFTMKLKLPDNIDFFEALKQAIQHESTETQNMINKNTTGSFYDDSISFSTGVVPLLSCLRKIPALKESHYALMIDDAQNLNPFQVKALNSWIAYRDNSLFSFKIATSKVGRPPLITSSGGTIIEGHDFTTIDLEQPYQNQYSNFGKLARKIVSLRLEAIKVQKSPEKFFPFNPQYLIDLMECKKVVQQRAKDKFPNGSKKQINDYIYKYTRAEYFRSRPPTANRPPYTGFETLVHLSTGVIRNLLEPCYWMYDQVLSAMRSSQSGLSKIEEIPPSIQNQIIMDRSKKKWEWIREGLDTSIEGCSKEQAINVFQLFDNLAILFRERLHRHESEPRAIVFTISDENFHHYEELEQILQIARKAQILYTYTSSAKDYGSREVYYVPNRILWPDRGLDPIGQHARVSIRAQYLWEAAKSNRQIPFSSTDKVEGDLFSE